METEKIRNLSDGELVEQERQAAEQLFRLRFQMKLGQNEGVKKLRELRKDIARIKTVARERELGLHGAAHEERADSAAGEEQRRQEGGSLNHDRYETQARPRRVPVAAEEKQARRNEKFGQVVSTKMQKTIVVEIEMRKAHPKYKRVMKTNKKFYAHDEQNSARVGDVVQDPRDPAVEQAEALAAGRDRSPFGSGPGGRSGRGEEAGVVHQVRPARLSELGRRRNVAGKGRRRWQYR